MAGTKAQGKSSEVERVTMDAARDGLTELVLRAGMQGRRYVLTRNGKPIAGLVGLDDLERVTGEPLAGETAA